MMPSASSKIQECDFSKGAFASTALPEFSPESENRDMHVADTELLALRPAWLSSIARIAKAEAEVDGIQDRVASGSPKERADLKIQRGDERYFQLRGRPTDGTHP